MRPTSDDLEADFDKARLNYGVPALNFAQALDMLDEIETRERRVRNEGRGENLEFVLDIFMVYDVERRAYKSFLARVFARRRANRNAEQDAREFAPLEVYEDDMR